VEPSKDVEPAQQAAVASAGQQVAPLHASGRKYVEQQVLEKLSRGWTQTQIAKSLGVDDSYVSQIANDPDNAEYVQVRAAESETKNQRFDDELDAGEEAFLHNIKMRSVGANLQQSLSAFKILNSAKRRRDTAPHAEKAPATVVNITLPAIGAVKYIQNAASEIVEVEGRTMISARPDQLPALMQAKLGRVPAEQKREVVAEERLKRAEEVLASVEHRTRRRIPLDKLDISDIS
jgi:transcriptional regulator with XRE-family HTH domain